jgi:hypothetical protein
MALDTAEKGELVTVAVTVTRVQRHWRKAARDRARLDCGISRRGPRTWDGMISELVINNASDNALCW